MSRENNTEYVNPEDIVKNISDVSGVMPEMVGTVLGSLEDVIFSKLLSASEDEDVKIKLFDGFFLESSYQKAKTKKNNLTGQMIEVPEKVNIRGRFSKAFKRKINEELV